MIGKHEYSKIGYLLKNIVTSKLENYQEFNEYIGMLSVPQKMLIEVIVLERAYNGDFCRHLDGLHNRFYAILNAWSQLP